MILTWQILSFNCPCGLDQNNKEQGVYQKHKDVDGTRIVGSDSQLDTEYLNILFLIFRGRKCKESQSLVHLHLIHGGSKVRE